MKNYHIYLNDKCLFKNLNQEEFDLIWDKIYFSYWREELTYVECIDDACIQGKVEEHSYYCLLYTSPSPRDLAVSRMPSSA